MKKNYIAPQLHVVEMGENLQPLCGSRTIQYDEEATTSSALSVGSIWNNGSWKEADLDDEED